MKCAVINLGCKVNQVESDTYLETLQKYGAAITEASTADLIIINTCAVTAEADKKSRKAIRKVLRSNPQAKLVVTGCSAALTPDVYRKLGNDIEVVPKSRMSDYLKALQGAKSLSNTEAGSIGTHYEDTTSPLPRRNRVGVKIQDGCNHRCSYCVIWRARGPSVSASHESIIEECKKLMRNGIMEIILTGINLGSYDDSYLSKRSYRLDSLLKDLLQESSHFYSEEGFLPRFRLSSIEPMDIGGSVIDTIAGAEGRIARHLHIPLQSGSSALLREMNRPYNAEDFIKLADKLYRCIPQLSLSTDLIVGFPGETAAEFQESLSLCAHCGFSKIHVFPYSARPDTPAAHRSDQISPQIKNERCKKAIELSNFLSLQDWNKRQENTEMILAEGSSTARTESYHLVSPCEALRKGSLTPVKLSSCTRII